MRWPWNKTRRQPAYLVLSDRGAKRLSIRGRYDAAQLNDDNRKHWVMADGLSADMANTVQVRQILRNRSRYEVANNSYARGIILTLANDTVGTGPRLQMLLEDMDELNNVIEREFACWARAAGLAARLRTMRMAKAQDRRASSLNLSNFFPSKACAASFNAIVPSR